MCPPRSSRFSTRFPPASSRGMRDARRLRPWPRQGALWGAGVSWASQALGAFSGTVFKYFLLLLKYKLRNIFPNFSLFSRTSE